MHQVVSFSPSDYSRLYVYAINATTQHKQVSIFEYVTCCGSVNAGIIEPAKTPRDANYPAYLQKSRILVVVEIRNIFWPEVQG